MIYDGIAAIEKYRGLNKNLDTLIDWFAENDPADLPLGKTLIDGERVFANTMEAKTKLPENARFETHRKYMDLQMDLEGVEDFMTTPGELEPLTEFDVDGDKGFWKAAEGNDDLLVGTLEKGHFAIFMVGEPHMPNLVHGDAEVGPLKKICFKILAE